jgi:crotonobetainyl-CoA:carnitine CoA-transferase CaiB-like acyl-CoA transferase
VTCEGALGGLYLREQAGRGCRVDASLLAGGMTLQAHVLEALRAGRESSRVRGRPVWGPLDRPLRTADGYIAIDAGEDGAFARLSRLCELEPRGASRLETETAIAERVRTGPSSQWEKALYEARIPCAAICSQLDKLAENPELAPLFEQLGGTSRAPRSPWRFLCA